MSVKLFRLFFYLMFFINRHFFLSRGGACSCSLTPPTRASPPATWIKTPGPSATSSPRASSSSSLSPSPKTSASTVSSQKWRLNKTRGMHDVIHCLFHFTRREGGQPDRGRPGRGELVPHPVPDGEDRQDHVVQPAVSGRPHRQQDPQLPRAVRRMVRSKQILHTSDVKHLKVHVSCNGRSLRPPPPHPLLLVKCTNIFYNFPVKYYSGFENFLVNWPPPPRVGRATWRPWRTESCWWGTSWRPSCRLRAPRGPGTTSPSRSACSASPASTVSVETSSHTHTHTHTHTRTYTHTHTHTHTYTHTYIHTCRYLGFLASVLKVSVTLLITKKFVFKGMRHSNLSLTLFAVLQ